MADVIRTQTPDGRAHVVGFSLGGLVGLHLAVRHPDAVRTLLASGVPLGSLSTPLRLANRLLAWLYVKPWGPLSSLEPAACPTRSHAQRSSTQPPGRPLRHCRGQDEIANGAVPPLDDLQVPTLAVVDSKDSAPARAFVHELPSVAPAATAAVVDAASTSGTPRSPSPSATLCGRG